MSQNNALYRVKKSPMSLPTKVKRYIKRNFIQKARASTYENKPYHLSFSELNKKLGCDSLVINEHYLFDTKQIQIDKDLLRHANDILQHNFTIFGKTTHLPELHWHYDFESGKIWEKQHFTKIVGENLEDKSDLKIPWELNRHHHFVTLALAYAKTGEEQYLTELLKQLDNWVEQNPYEVGINWMIPMEVGIRAINWITMYHLLYHDLSEETQHTINEQLYLSAVFIEENLEWTPAKENHYLTDIVALYFIGTHFSNTKQGTHWKHFAHKELEKEMEHQVSEDGVHYEAALNYHRLATELFLLAHILAEKNNEPFSDTYKNRLEHMLEFIMYVTSFTGRVPIIGDTDDGRILDIWNIDVQDWRDLLAIGAVYFNRADFKNASNWHNTLTLLTSKDDYEKIQPDLTLIESKAFKDFYIMRNDHVFVLIHAGDIGRDGFGGHGHNDQLSFVFSTTSGDHIIDPGVGHYTGNIKVRHHFRSTDAHNCLVVNGLEQNPIYLHNPFGMDDAAKTKCVEWRTSPAEDLFVGEHYGYEGITVSRKIHYDKKTHLLTITDSINKPAQLRLTYTLGTSRIRIDRGNYYLNNDVEIMLDDAQLVDVLASLRYRNIVNRKALRVETKGNELITTIKIKPKRMTMF